MSSTIETNTILNQKLNYQMCYCLSREVVPSLDRGDMKMKIQWTFSEELEDFITQ